MSVLVVHSSERAAQLKRTGETRRLVVIGRADAAHLRLNGLCENVAFDELFDANVAGDVSTAARDLARGANMAAEVGLGRGNGASEATSSPDGHERGGEGPSGGLRPRGEGPWRGVRVH